jgi:uncharacterized protein YdeI (YjbR/CyaY-like superfamily)
MATIWQSAGVPAITEVFRARDASHWRSWLEKNHARRDHIWLALAPKHRGDGVTYREALDEALCFGWIDGVRKLLDENRYTQRFTPRKKRSAWSDVNKKRVAELLAQHRVAAPGLAAIEAAKASGEWSRARIRDGVRMPAELTAALASSQRAQAAWATLTPGSQRLLRLWVGEAKRGETRQTRARSATRRLAAGDRTPWT